MDWSVGTGVQSSYVLLGVTGSSAARYSLSVATTGVDALMPLRAELSITERSGYASAFINQTISAPFPVYAIRVGSDAQVTDESELLLNVYFSSLTNASTGYQRPWASLTLFPSYPILNSSSTSYMPTLTASSYDGAALLINRRTRVPLTANTTYYLTVQLENGNSFHLVASLRRCTRLALGQMVQDSLMAGATASYSLTLPARKVGGQWWSAANFTAAVSSLDSTASYPGPFLYLTAANTVNVTSLSPWSTYSWRMAQRTSGSQVITAADFCGLSTCTWTAVVYSVAPDTRYTFSFAPVSSHRRLVPGLTTQPHYVAADQMAYWSFVLPHPQMRVDIALQSLLSGVDGDAAANADVFVSRLTSRPDSRYSEASSQLDDADGRDVVTLDGLNATTVSQFANTTFYVAVFGQRASNYTLTVTALDVEEVATAIGDGQPTEGVVTAGSSRYHQLRVGSAAAASNLSVILSTNCSTCSPQLYATFSYSRPGPLTSAGQTAPPPSLPYEVFALHSTSVAGLQTKYAQLTLGQMPALGSGISSLQSHSSLYIAVYGAGMDGSATPMPYQLTVCGEPRLTLTAGSSLTSPEAGAAGAGPYCSPYYSFSFADSSRQWAAGPAGADRPRLSHVGAALPVHRRPVHQHRCGPRRLIPHLLHQRRPVALPLLAQLPAGRGLCGLRRLLPLLLHLPLHSPHLRHLPPPCLRHRPHPLP